MWQVQRWNVVAGGWEVVASFSTLTDAYATMLALPLANVLMANKQLRCNRVAN